MAQLASIDTVFSEFDISGAGSSSCSYSVPAGTTSQELKVTAEQMSNDIIDFDRDEIARRDNEPNPTIYFKRSLGINRSLKFTKIRTNRLRIKFSLGGNYNGIFNIEYLAMNEEKYYSLEWYENVIKCLIDFFNPKYCSLTYFPCNSKTTFPAFSACRNLKKCLRRVPVLSLT